ncbi:MAG: hypothetical protein A3I31_00550 [Candidatus Colwellbacteria bacterium RIFCSPLOWO2_02_FULL_44_20b]|uniref:Uncharacterized protein n=1 Tax=Candidatus Colwellbacteria bacterium RIFCSPLOWO2_02_FULL_44_20b TaxID=1797691 RepID=A0A1G1Z4T9_9BACT|nr:MAG: hypothetical protein A3I31_00550 [Candidatus Colwellbacteria bacterium RIFCSPLOWO2_02_FULL_44_20b]
MTNELNDLEEVKSQWLKFGKVGDWLRGTLIDVRDMDNQMKPGEKIKIYEFLAHDGSFHFFKKVNGQIVIDEEPTILEKGSIWAVSGKPGIDSQMRSIKRGQIFGMLFSAEKPNVKNPSYNSTKIIKVLVGGVDPKFRPEVEVIGAEN